MRVSVGLVALSKQEKRNQDEFARTNETIALTAKIHKENIERQRREEKLRPPYSDELLPMVDQVIITIKEGKPIDVGGESLEIDANVELDNIDGLDDDFRFPEDLDASKPDDFLDAIKPEVSKLKPVSTLESSPAPVSLLSEFSVSPSINKSSEAHMHPLLLSTKAAFPPNGGQNREDATASGEAATWKTVRQLVTFREQSAKVVNDWLKKRRIRLDKGKKRKKCIENKEAYVKGKQDSKKVHVRAARVEHTGGEHDDKKGTGTREVRLRKHILHVDPPRS